MKNWAEEKIEQIQVQLEGSNEKDLRFFRVAEFERMIRRTDEFAPTCAECQKMKAEIEMIVAQISEAIHQPGKQRRAYDRLIDRLARHQRKVHGFYPPYYFTYLYSFFGLVGGTALGALAWLGFEIQPVSYFLLTGSMIGLLAARILGSHKDQQLRDRNKLL